MTESDNNYYRKSDVYTKTQSDTNYHTKTQINTDITTGKTNVKTGGLTLYADSFVNFSNVLCCRTNAPSTFYNELNSWYGYGDPELGVLTPFNRILNMPSNGTAFNGINILRNGLLHLCSSNSLVISSVLNNVEIYGNKIYFIGDVFTSTGTLAKKTPKYFTTSRTANFDGISCLAYDIDLTKITSTQTIDTNDFRHFRIKFFFANGRLDYQRTPRTFEVSMSTYNTLSVSCFDGLGYVSSLDKAFSSEYFLYKQNFNMITFCLPTSMFGVLNLKVCYILEDLIST
jgi:uncharacterized Zn-binding protein involved in type VI secretion